MSRALSGLYLCYRQAAILHKARQADQHCQRRPPLDPASIHGVRSHASFALLTLLRLLLTLLRAVALIPSEVHAALVLTEAQGSCRPDRLLCSLRSLLIDKRRPRRWLDDAMALVARKTLNSSLPNLGS